MAEIATARENPALPARKPASRFWWLGLFLASNAILLWLGLTEDAITIGKTLKKEIAWFTVRLVDERQTFSILSAIFKLRADGNTFLFCVILLFSVVFPIAKLGGNSLIWVTAMRTGRIGEVWMARGARSLHWLGKWSMLEVFVAAMLCVLLKLGDVTRFKIEAGMYWFFAAVFLSLVNAKLTEKALAHKETLREDLGAVRSTG